MLLVSPWDCPLPVSGPAKSNLRGSRSPSTLTQLVRLRVKLARVSEGSKVGDGEGGRELARPAGVPVKSMAELEDVEPFE